MQVMYDATGVRLQAGRQAEVNSTFLPRDFLCSSEPPLRKLNWLCSARLEIWHENAITLS